MVSVWRVYKIGGALYLSVGIGVMAITRAVIGQSIASNPVPLVSALAGSYCVAYVLLSRVTDVDHRLLWRFSGVVFILFIIGNVLTTDGIYAPAGQESLFIVVGLWGLSLGIAYVLVTVTQSVIEPFTQRN